MAQRGFGGIQTLAGTAVPAYGTTLSAASTLHPDLFTGQTGTSGNRSLSTVPVATGTAQRFRAGDRILIGTSSQFEQTNTTAPDGGTVQSVNGSTDVLTVAGLNRVHAANEFAVLAISCSEISIKTVTASSSVEYGEDPTVAANSTTLLDVQTAGEYFEYGKSSTGNVLETQHLWVNGGAGGQFLPTFVTV